jgi:hypothetical protein
MLVGAGHALNTVTIGKIAIGADVEISHVNRNRAVKATEKGLPVFPVGCGADILTRRDDIENDQRLVGCLHLHDRVDVFRLERGNKAIHKAPNVGPVVGPRRAAESHDGKYK